MQIPQDIIEAHRKIPWTVAPQKGGSDRTFAIVVVAELEELARSALAKFIAGRHPGLPHNEVRNLLRTIDVKDDTSLTRRAKLLHALGVIDRSHRDDLMKLYEIRTIYAH